METGSREQNASPLWNWIAVGSREQNGASSLMGMLHKIKNGRYDGLHGGWWIFSQQTLYPVLQPTGLVADAAGNPSRPVDGINTIGMLLTLAKANTTTGYPGVSTEDEGRDPDYFSLAYLGTR
eukprot:Gb_10218 [translate_table: standard]